MLFIPDVIEEALYEVLLNVFLPMVKSDLQNTFLLASLPGRLGIGFVYIT